MQSNFIEIAFRGGCYPVNVLHILKTTFLKSTSGRLLLKILIQHLGIFFFKNPLCCHFDNVANIYIGLSKRFYSVSVYTALAKKKMNESGNFIAIKQSWKTFFKKRRINFGNFKLFLAVDFDKLAQKQALYN